MTSAKIAITLEQDLLKRLDHMVSRHIFKNRSQAIQEAVKLRLEQDSHSLLIRECEKLDIHEERALAEEGLLGDLEQWPIY